MKIKEHIAEITNRISSAVISGEYEVVRFENHTVVVKIEDLEFEIWISNGAQYLKLWNLGGLLKEPFGGESTRNKVWGALDPVIKHHQSTTLKAEKLATIARLQSELDALDALNTHTQTHP